MTGTQPPLPPGPPHAGAPAGSGFFDGIRARSWRRPVSSAIGGVCAAFADRHGVDRVLVRVVLVLAGLLVSPLLPLVLVGYAAGWLLIPDRSGRILAEEVLRGRWSWPPAGALLLALIGLATVDSSSWVGFTGLGSWLPLLVLVTAGVVVYLVRDREERPTSTAPATWAPPVGPPAGGGPPSPPGAPGVWEPPQAGPGYPAPSVAGAPVPGLEPDDESTISLAKRPAAGSLPADLPSGSSARDCATMTAAPPSGPAWPPPAPVTPATSRAPRRPAAGAAACGLVAGLALLATGGVLLAGVLGLLPDMFVTAQAAAITALTIVAISIIVVGLAGRRAGALSVLAVLALLGLIVTSAAQAGKQVWDVASAQWQTQTWAPEGQILESRTYQAEFGNRVLDLGQVQKLSPGQSPKTIDVRIDMGAATIRVPEGLTVNLDLKADMGAIDLPGDLAGGEVRSADDSSFAVVRTIGEGPADVNVVARVATGNITVERDPAQASPAEPPATSESPASPESPTIPESPTSPESPAAPEQAASPEPASPAPQPGPAVTPAPAPTPEQTP